jgi:asparagine synthase (glutamine-hydrolysing)
MAVSLEARLPLLGHRVVEMAWSLPSRFKRGGQTTKWLLREMLARHLPRNTFERPKMGFGIPLGQWLRGPLRDWAQALLDGRELREDRHLNAELIRTRWHEHLNQTRDWSYLIWTVLMFVAWKERWM